MHQTLPLRIFKKFTSWDHRIISAYLPGAQLIPELYDLVKTYQIHCRHITTRTSSIYMLLNIKMKSVAYIFVDILQIIPDHYKPP